MHLRRAISCGIAALMLGGVPSRAHASCLIVLRGDPVIATQIRAELDQFTDDGSACVALEITCGASDGGLTLELDDELGGHALRTFDSAGGAGAFVISWSRRPGVSSLTSSGGGSLLSPDVEARVDERTTAAPGTTRPAAWRGEFHGAYLFVPKVPAIGLGAALVQHHGIVRAGFAARLIGALPIADLYDEHGTSAYLGGQLEGALGVQGHLGFDGHPRWVRLRAELAAGGSMITRTSDDAALAFVSGGPHGAARVTAGWGMGGGVQLEIGVGFELAWQAAGNYNSPIGEAEIQPYPHLDIGLGWAP